MAFGTDTPQQALLRQKNRATVEKYLATSGIARAECFTPDGIKELTFATHASPLSPDNTSPVVWKGRTALEENFRFNAANFTGSWLNPKVYETQDPNKFWVETALDAVYVVDDKKVPYRQPYYVMSFDMHDGLIERFREIFNPIELIRTHGCTDKDGLFRPNTPIT
ncbi:phenazine biosynthesis protein A/B [Aspergillus heterothallicus]